MLLELLKCVPQEYLSNQNSPLTGGKYHGEHFKRILQIWLGIWELKSLREYKNVNKLHQDLNKLNKVSLEFDLMKLFQCLSPAQTSQDYKLIPHLKVYIMSTAVFCILCWSPVIWHEKFQNPIQYFGRLNSLETSWLASQPASVLWALERSIDVAHPCVPLARLARQADRLPQFIQPQVGPSCCQARIQVSPRGEMNRRTCLMEQILRGLSVHKTQR